MEGLDATLEKQSSGPEVKRSGSEFLRRRRRADEDSHAVPRKLLLHGSFHCGSVGRERVPAWTERGARDTWMGAEVFVVYEGVVPTPGGALEARGSRGDVGGTWEFRMWLSGRGHAVSAATLRGSMGSE